jgi:sugar phosphate isomerase/epimerase
MIQRKYALAQLMALPYSPPQMVQLAADTGCMGVGIRLLPTTPGGLSYPLQDDPAMLRETLARMAATGVKVLDLEVLRINERFDLGSYGSFLETAQKLGARHILVACDDPDESRMAASFAALCEAATPYGLTADLEFMPWTDMRDVQAAARICRAAAQPNGGILVDALHFGRCGSTLDDIRSLPREWLHYAQICDGPVPGPTTTEGLIHAARCERHLPGEGGLDLHGLFAALPADITVSLEVPSDSRAPVMGYEAWTRTVMGAADSVLLPLRA